MNFKAKDAYNPNGYGQFLTKKLVKKVIFRTILPYPDVAKAIFDFLQLLSKHNRVLILTTY